MTDLTLEQALARIAELEEELAPYKEAEAEAARDAAERQRLEQVCSRLFPQFNGRFDSRNQAARPIQWHEKSWWWNGGHIDWDETYKDQDGGWKVTLTSYVGCGDSESISLIVPTSLLGDNWEQAVDAYKQAEFNKREAARIAQEAAKAQRQIAEAQATLRRLGA